MQKNRLGTANLWAGHAGWILSLFLIGLGAKFFLILKSNGPLAYYDQWDGEGIDLYVPYFEHALSFLDLFKAHNEHRIFFTRLCDLVLLVLNGQWDSQLQMTVNAMLHCATIAGFGWLMARLLGRGSWPLIWLPLAFMLALPFGWENALWGFQSQFYFQLLFSLLTIWLLGMSRAGSARWRLGIAAGVMSFFTTAAGFLGAAAVAGMCLLDMARERRNWRRQLPTLIAAAALLAVGMVCKGYDPHNLLLVQSPRAFFLALGKNLAWPWPFSVWAAPLNLFPLALLGWIYFRSREEDLRAERMILATGLWVVVLCVATAYARGATGYPPMWRYMDTTSFLMLADWLGIVVVLRRHRRKLRLAPVWYAGFAVWFGVCLSGLWVLSDLAERGPIPSWNVRQAIRLENTRAFMATDNEHVFDGEEMDNLAFPYAPELVALLREKDIRRVLPACAREPLRVAANGAGDGAFTMNGWLPAKADAPTEKGWGSYSATGAKARGKFESLPVKESALPYLEIPVAGDLGEPGLSLELVESGTGKVTEVKPPTAPGETWSNVQVKAPAGEFKMVANDDSETKWFAFKEPREMGRLSYGALELLRGWRIFLAAGLGCLLWSVAGELFRPGVEREKGNPSSG